MKIANSIVELIGNTPMVKLNKLVGKEDAEVYLKLEFFNPGSSVKDRIALNMIETAEKEGKLKKGSVIVEPTSGNTGIGLAMIGAAKGYKVILVMPDTMSIERRKLLKAFGAEIVLTDGAIGMKGAIEKANEIVRNNPSYFMPQQFENRANPEAHKNTTALEILEQMDNQFDMLIAGVGTGGTITGIGEMIKKQIKDVKVVAIEPKNSAVLSGEKSGPHKIQGIGAGFIPNILNTKIIDEIIKIEDEDAMETARKIAVEEGILVGISSGAAIYGAIKKAKELGKGKKIVVIVPSYGERYLSTPLFDFE
ncbi:cysteine synthase A [Crassaminicella thermophila]|uniref:Cysteine synthase n=1 Tax=Crassaminicella thermophila TaxID=2599308 RepID=A0A5C0SD06_CRATE|nr:cysteine synthase A [Crassaminicella thermophila]QEK12403.1 cysteine synthase A [Crassaminicella thermophila]